MLDYILSKMVLLIFLVLLVAAFTGFQGALHDYFVQQHAQDIVRNLAERLRGMVVATTRLQETRTFVPPRYIEVGGRKIPYEINCVPVEQDDTNWVVFSILVADRVIAYDGVAITNASVDCKGFPVSSTSGKAIYMTKNVSGTDMGSQASYLIQVEEGP